MGTVRASVAVPAIAVAAGLAAVLVRVHLIRHSGVLSIGGYDDGVHYAAAAALVHGRLPYRDVLLLQPPGMVLAATPFAALGQLIGDAKAFGGARLAFAVVGGLNAALVVLVARRLGLVAALVGGALYAASFPAVYAERTLILEVLGTTGLLLSLLGLDRARATGRRRWWLLAGAVAGLTVGVKIWYVVPFAVLLLGARGGRLRFLIGGAVAGAAVYVPFFVPAPAQMWQQVVLAQLDRPDDSTVTLARRVRSVLGVTAPGSTTPLPHVPGALVGGVLAVVAVALVLLAVTDRRARLLVGLLAACAVLLAATPSYFQHYSALTAAPLALVAGAGMQRLAGLLPGRGLRLAAVLAVVLLAVALNQRHDAARYGDRAPVRALRDAAAQVPGCIVADDPTVLIVMNRLSPDLARGCAMHADPSGAGYLLDDAEGRRDVERLYKPAYQRAILDYLWSGDAYLWVRGDGLQLTPAIAARVEQGVPLLERGRWVLRSTPGR